jgi:hypothetical protein
MELRAGIKRRSHNAETITITHNDIEGMKRTYIRTHKQVSSGLHDFHFLCTLQFVHLIFNDSNLLPITNSDIERSHNNNRSAFTLPSLLGCSKFQVCTLECLASGTETSLHLSLVSSRFEADAIMQIVLTVNEVTPSSEH